MHYPNKQDIQANMKMYVFKENNRSTNSGAVVWHHSRAQTLVISKTVHSFFSQNKSGQN
jgi:hypothetical protein